MFETNDRAVKNSPSLFGIRVIAIVCKYLNIIISTDERTVRSHDLGSAPRKQKPTHHYKAPTSSTMILLSLHLRSMAYGICVTPEPYHQFVRTGISPSPTAHPAVV
ncbi:hypothetical protein TNCV_5112151 [Trichonephila clavipes]|nr:hypothetical protein TNCV_5112151 [Trichonephila clavipes]